MVSFLSFFFALLACFVETTTTIWIYFIKCILVNIDLSFNLVSFFKKANDRVKVYIAQKEQWLGWWNVVSVEELLLPFFDRHPYMF